MPLGVASCQRLEASSNENGRRQGARQRSAKMKARIVGLCAAGLLFGGVTSVRADPIRADVTNGTIELGRTSATFHFFEPGIVDVTGTLLVPAGYEDYNWPRFAGQSLP